MKPFWFYAKDGGNVDQRVMQEKEMEEKCLQKSLESNILSKVNFCYDNSCIPVFQIVMNMSEMIWVLFKMDDPMLNKRPEAHSHFHYCFSPAPDLDLLPPF